ncbi:uncharacterized protein G2W53_003978 [Senna tora]|uniref:Uncharacterized protein n=1 Tax=Senna tora TaxID=362788 RepID=A0A835CIW9_9FABA|nr:uncharacterized protein G2W53_003978 [Senna tora]
MSMALLPFSSSWSISRILLTTLIIERMGLCWRSSRISLAICFVSSAGYLIKTRRKRENPPFLLVSKLPDFNTLTPLRVSS